ncbi:MAG TPA: phosphoenolpyruvate--protein phosphotransferase [Negativicutes bacterium]|nr:phosphoenolpyruvate--protein phosphotransferase [Negativicutes bacterium]
MKGMAVSAGIAVAKAYVTDDAEIIIKKDKIAGERINSEIEALYNALERTKAQLQCIYEAAAGNTGEENASIIQTHIAISDDQMLLDIIRKKIEEEHFNAVFAVESAICEQIRIFEDIEDPYIRERAADIRDVGSRIIKNLCGIPIMDIGALKDDVIIVGKELTPSMLAGADRKHVKGLVSEVGGMTSHIAIMARGMDIPAVFGVKGIADCIKQGQLVAIDGSTGTIQTDICPEGLADLQQKIAEKTSMKEVLRALTDKKSATLDGHVVELCANIGYPSDVAKVMADGAEGIGLFRTEYLFMDRKAMPGEEEQFSAYKQAAESMGEKPVTIRTLDVGGDKKIPYFGISQEENPFLGYRAIRICLDDREMFRVQLRAILRASAFGQIRIMYPMISTVEEVISANAVLEEAKRELEAKGVGFDRNIKVGIMVEIPSAAIAADIIVKHVDFFSIGTNDLTQYTLAVDRTNTRVDYLYNSFEPAILRLIQNVIDVSHREGKYTGMCGELAGNPVATLLLLGMGLDEFSMNSSSILKARKIILSADTCYAKELRDEVLRLSDPHSIERYLKDALKNLKLDYLLNI